MSNNQKNNEDQQSDHASKEQGGKKKRELDPNNPKANQNDEQNSKMPRSESDTNVTDSKGKSSKVN